MFGWPWSLIILIEKLFFLFRIIGDTLSNQKIISQIYTYLLNYYRLEFASSLKLGIAPKISYINMTKVLESCTQKGTKKKYFESVHKKNHSNVTLHERIKWNKMLFQFMKEKSYVMQCDICEYSYFQKGNIKKDQFMKWKKHWFGWPWSFLTVEKLFFLFVRISATLLIKNDHDH